MIQIMQNWRPQPNAAYFKKEPDSSELGKKIVSEGLSLMQELGFDAFTFRKLAEKLHTTEASVYRYFENKHHLLLYYISIYWMWLEHQITFGTHNMDPKLKLDRAIELITHPESSNWSFQDLRFEHMQNLLISEWGKVYYSQQIDAEYQSGLFSEYKQFCKRLSNLIEESYPHYTFPNALVTTMMNTLFAQGFYAHHLPSLTELKQDDVQLTQFIKSIVNGALNTPIS